MADPYSSGLSFRNFISGSALPAAHFVANPLDYALNRGAAIGTGIAEKSAPTVADFLGGLLGSAHNSVTMKLPAATSAKAPVAKAAAAPAAAAAKAPAGKAAAAGADPLAALGNLSFRQLLTLSQASENLQQRGVVKQPTTTDAAGAALAAIYQQQFKSSVDAAGKDPAKQQAAIDAFEKKMLPIALKGNTADEYLYGNQ